eukprot:s1160_g7.t1
MVVMCCLSLYGHVEHRAAVRGMCSCIGVVAMTEPAANDAYSRMLHEALLHLAERLDQVCSDVQRIDSSVTALAERVAQLPKPPPLPKRPCLETTGGTAGLTKRVLALEHGQRAVAAGARRALRKAVTAHRAVQDRSLGKPAAAEPCTWDLPGWLDGFLQQERAMSHLDGQVTMLASSLRMHTALAQRSVEGQRPGAATGKSLQEPSAATIRHQDRDVPELSPHRELALQEECSGRSWQRHGTHREPPTGRPESKEPSRDPTLIELIEEAVEEAEMEQLQKAAHDEASKLRKDLMRVGVTGHGAEAFRANVYEDPKVKAFLEPGR